MKGKWIPLAALLLALSCASSSDEADQAVDEPTEDAVPERPDPSDDAMVFVPGGEYTIGNDERPEKQKDTVQYFEPAHKVEVKPYCMDTYEVTFEQFLDFDIAEKEYRIQGDWRKYFGAGMEWHPVANILYEDAKEYCAWAGKRLPTEQEWEVAARGSDERRYTWGNEWDVMNANTNERGGATAEVGSSDGDKSEFGAYDLFGNVQEWTESIFKAYPGNKNRRDQFYRRNLRVVRGSSYAMKGRETALWLRSAWPDNMQSGFGFRCVKDAEKPADCGVDK